MNVSVRPYRPTDHRAGRALWAEFIETKRELYGEPGGHGDPGAGFEEYLTQLNLTGMWVAEHPEDGVIGLVGLLLSGRAGEVNPVVVTERYRGQGVGRALLAHVAEEARRRGLRQLAVVPDSRNVAAFRCLHAAGYDRMAAVRLTLDLTGASSTGEQMTVHGLSFRY